MTKTCKKWSYLNEITMAAKDCKKDTQNEFINSVSHSLSKEVRIQPSNLLTTSSSPA